MPFGLNRALFYKYATKAVGWIAFGGICYTVVRPVLSAFGIWKLPDRKKLQVPVDYALTHFNGSRFYKYNPVVDSIIKSRDPYMYKTFYLAFKDADSIRIVNFADAGYSYVKDGKKYHTRGKPYYQRNTSIGLIYTQPVNYLFEKNRKYLPDTIPSIDTFEWAGYNIGWQLTKSQTDTLMSKIRNMPIQGPLK